MKTKAKKKPKTTPNGVPFTVLSEQARGVRLHPPPPEISIDSLYEKAAGFDARISRLYEAKEATAASMQNLDDRILKLNQEIGKIWTTFSALATQGQELATLKREKAALVQGFEVAEQRSAEAKAMVETITKEMNEALKGVRQQVHQAHHEGPIESCAKGTCKSISMALGELAS